MEIDDLLLQDDVVFHYTRASIALEFILHDKRLRLSRFGDTNDPREYKDWNYSAFGAGNMPDNFDSTFVNTISITEEIVRKEHRIACFCANPVREKSKAATYEDNLSYGFGRSRMWSQYGQDHRGVCIAFSMERLESELYTLLEDPKLFTAGRVEYVDKSPVPFAATSFNANAFLSTDLNSYCRDHVTIHRKSIFLTKQKDYIDEQEYRLVVYDRDNKHQYINISKAIIALLIGDRFHEVYLPSIRRLCRNLGIPCRQVYWSQGVPFLLNAWKEKLPSDNSIKPRRNQNK